MSLIQENMGRRGDDRCDSQPFSPMGPSYHPPALSVTTDQKDTEYIGGWEAARKVTGINEGVGMKML